MILVFYMNCLGVSRVNLLADSNIGSFKDADSVTNISRLKHITYAKKKIQQQKRQNKDNKIEQLTTITTHMQKLFVISIGSAIPCC